MSFYATYMRETAWDRAYGDTADARSCEIVAASIRQACRAAMPSEKLAYGAELRVMENLADKLTVRAVALTLGQRKVGT